MCWVIGGLFSTGVLTGLMKNTTQWGYRIPFALQWIWPIPIILATLLAPERYELMNTMAQILQYTDEMLQPVVADSSRPR